MPTRPVSGMKTSDYYSDKGRDHGDENDFKDPDSGLFPQRNFREDYLGDAVKESFEDFKKRAGVVDETAKPSNPKDLIGSNKVPFHLWPETASAHGAMALLDGALKYGRGNWLAVGVRASIYYDAARRHLNGYFWAVEDNDPDSGLWHLGHALACIAILVDAQEAGMLTDDRAYKNGYRTTIDRLTKQVADIRAKYAGRNPKHYTREDTDNERGFTGLVGPDGRRIDVEGGDAGYLIGRALGPTAGSMAYGGTQAIAPGGETGGGASVKLSDAVQTVFGPRRVSRG